MPQPAPFIHPLDRPDFDLHVGDRFVEHTSASPTGFYLAEIGARRGDRRDRYSVELLTLGTCDADGGDLRAFDFGKPVRHMVPSGFVQAQPERFVAVASLAVAA